jgi:hypothetical protein
MGQAEQWLQDAWLHLATLETLPEVDWSRMRSHLDFQEALRARDMLCPRTYNMRCRSCPMFESHVCVSCLEFDIVTLMQFPQCLSMQHYTQ